MSKRSARLTTTELLTMVGYMLMDYKTAFPHPTHVPTDDEIIDAICDEVARDNIGRHPMLHAKVRWADWFGAPKALAARFVNDPRYLPAMARAYKRAEVA